MIKEDMWAIRSCVAVEGQSLSEDQPFEKDRIKRMRGEKKINVHK